jgi:ketosteroid isomerase-like protein
VFIMRVREGLIVESRDYVDPMAHVRALANAERKSMAPNASA